MVDVLVQDKDIVVPGEVLAEGMDYLPVGSVFREENKLIASKLGVVNINGRLIKVIPLSSTYAPRRGDIVIGRVVYVSFNGWKVDLGWGYEANLLVRDMFPSFNRNVNLFNILTYGDWVVAEVSNMTDNGIIDLRVKEYGPRRLSPGRIIKINPAKTLRVIGKEGSMISLIKQYTESKIIVGQNGIIWLSSLDPKKEMVAVKVIKEIEEKAHVSGLTDSIKAFLEKTIGVLPPQVKETIVAKEETDEITTEEKPKEKVKSKESKKE